MKPEDIIKALRCSATPGKHDCTGCPYVVIEKLNGEEAEIFGTSELESCECDKIALDAAELLTTYRDAEPELTIEDIAYAYLQICEKDCAGDCITGIPPCRFYNPPDVGLFGEPLPYGCELEDYCGYRSEVALKEQEDC